MSETPVAARKMTATSKSFILASNAFFSVLILITCVGQFFNTHLFSPGLSFKNQCFKLPSGITEALKRTIRDYTTLPMETLICVKPRQERMTINTILML